MKISEKKKVFFSKKNQEILKKKFLLPGFIFFSGRIHNPNPGPDPHQ